MPHRKPIPALTVDPAKKLSLIKKEFNDHYPYLKLEFFKGRHKPMGANPKKDIIDLDQPLKQLRAKAGDHTVVITQDMPVGQVEQLFQEQFGIAVQVFRKSGRSWLETSLTDDWTLKRQNDQGRELSNYGESGKVA